ncbi:zinc-binding dehydrogenase [Micromonospora terminaliae]|uniref:zinc-binding dehydrogenase n=1 Tax=Micromonospora terminaliae TaxID=1914461 RepID=UPI001954E7E7|nr:zinc-binding dehydrogenase [Micromonospora terminaliae]
MTYGANLTDRVRAVAVHGVDAALDAAGRGSLRALVELTGNPVRVIGLADPLADALGARFAYGEPDDMAGILTEVAALVTAGTMKVSVARTDPLTDAAAAHRASQTGHVRGSAMRRRALLG